MRLNRVLQLNRVPLLVATITAMFALVFTISCSDGSDGKNGKPGKGCDIQKDGDVWNIICNDTKIGELTGHAGEQGEQGDPGANGTNGIGCTLGAAEGTSYPILCGANNARVGTLEGCSAERLGDYELFIDCGSTVLNLCSGVAFSRTEHACSATGALSDPSELEFCNGKPIITGKQYCGWAKEDIGSAKEEKTVIYEFCAGDIDEAPNSGLAPPESEEEWEYCQYVSATVAVASVNRCQSGETINDGSWKGEYCGWKDSKATKTTLLTGACDNIGWATIKNPDGSYTIETAIGPNQIAVGQGYCTVLLADKATGETSYTENWCGGPGKTTNAINEKTWKNEYCGYANAAAQSSSGAGLAQKYPLNSKDALCDDGQGPHAVTYNRGYCGFGDAKGSYSAIGTWTSLSSSSRAISGLGGSILLTEFCDDGTKPNEVTKPGTGKWLNEYCGVKSGTNLTYGIHPVTKSSSSFYKTTKIATLCGDGGKPNNSRDLAYDRLDACTWSAGSGISILATNDHKCPATDAAADQTNMEKWVVVNLVSTPLTATASAYKKEYCGFTANSSSAKRTDGCGDGTGPNKTLDAALDKNMYCGWSYSAASLGEKVNVSPLTTALYKCWSSSAGATPNNGTKFNYEYCGWENSSSSKMLLKNDMCGDGTRPANPYVKDAYCGMSSPSQRYTTKLQKCTDVIGLSSSSAENYQRIELPLQKVNEYRWQNQYCVYYSSSSSYWWTGAAGSSSSVKIFEYVGGLTCPSGLKSSASGTLSGICK